MGAADQTGSWSTLGVLAEPATTTARIMNHLGALLLGLALDFKLTPLPSLRGIDRRPAQPAHESGPSSSRLKSSCS